MPLLRRFGIPFYSLFNISNRSPSIFIAATKIILGIFKIFICGGFKKNKRTLYIFACSISISKAESKIVHSP